jgi:DNA-directed RNA polymerase specialized sigma24 family protein
MAFFDQLPAAVIAREMGISRPAASMLLIRAVKALRRSVRTTGETGPGR